MAEIWFPDGTKLSDYAKKVDYATLALFNVFTNDQKISKNSPVVYINNTTTTASSIVFQRSDDLKGEIALGTADDLEFKVAATKKFKFVVG